MKKIAFISVMGGSPWGGSEELWYRTARLALKEGHEVLISILKWPEEVGQIVELRNLGAHIHYRKHPFSGDNQPPNLLNRVKNRVVKKAPYYEKEINEIQEFGASIICVSQGSAHDIFAFKGVQDLVMRNKTILITQGSMENFIPAPEVTAKARSIYPLLKNCVFVAERNRELVKLQICNDLLNSTIIYNPYSGEIPNEISQLNSVDKINFAIVGRINCNHKGHHILLQILSRPLWKERNWHLNIYGDGPDLEFMKDLSEYLGIHERISFHGYVDSKEAIWSVNDVLVLPSFYEGTPLVLIEAMMHGRPAVVNDVGGNTEVAIDGETAFISKAPTSYFFEEAMETAWERRNEWKRMGIEARNRIEKFMQTAPERQLLDLLQT